MDGRGVKGEMMTGDDLKYSILQLAMSGKLVEQRPEEGTGENLFKKMQVDRLRLIQSNKIKKDKPLSKVSSEEFSYEVPHNWKVVRVGEVGSWASGATPSRSHPEYYGGSVPWLKTGDLNDGDIFSVSEAITEEGFQHSSVRLNPIGSVLMAMYGATIGKLGILQIESTTNQACCACICYEGMLNKFLFYYLLSQRKNFIAMGAGGAQPNISKEKIINSAIPLPPLAEQKRIVAKIEELMPLVEQYTVKSEKLNSLNASFPELMKKSILQEAVQGRLVPQDTDDEPASVLLKKIADEKKRLVRERKIKKQKPLPEITEEEVPFEVPEGWEWVRLGTVLNLLTDGTHKTPHYVPEGVPFVSVKDMSSGKLSFSNTKFISETEADELNMRCNPEKGDILLSKVGTTGIPAPVDTDIKFSIFVSVALLKFNTDLINRDYLINVICSPCVQKQCADNTRGVGNKNWVMRDIANTMIPIAPLKEQERIVSQLKRILSLPIILGERMKSVVV